MDGFLENNSEIKKCILQDEELLWSGRPVKQIKLLPAEKFNMMFGAFWTAFSTLWIIMGFVSPGDTTQNSFFMSKVFPFFGIPFLIVGIHMLLIAPLIAKCRRKNIEYALTSERILILYSGKKNRLKTFRYEEISNLNFGCDENDVGVLTFNATSYISGTRLQRPVIYGFYNVSEIKKIYKILCNQLGEQAK